MNITIFSEYGKDFRENEAIRAMHPKGLHETLKEIFSSVGHVTTVYQDDGDHCARFTEEILNNTDVLVWWDIACTRMCPTALRKKSPRAYNAAWALSFCIRRICPSLSAV